MKMIQVVVCILAVMVLFVIGAESQHAAERPLVKLDGGLSQVPVLGRVCVNGRCTPQATRFLEPVEQVVMVEEVATLPQASMVVQSYEILLEEKPAEIRLSTGRCECLQKASIFRPRRWLFR